MASCGPAPAEPPPPCPLVASDGWNAVVTHGAGRGAARLTVTGRLTMPARGWWHAWTRFAQLDSSPPSAIVDLMIYSEQGANDPVSQEVRGEWSTSPKLAEITIRCGGGVIGQLIPTMTSGPR